MFLVTFSDTWTTSLYELIWHTCLMHIIICMLMDISVDYRCDTIETTKQNTWKLVCGVGAVFIPLLSQTHWGFVLSSFHYGAESAERRLCAALCSLHVKFHSVTLKHQFRENRNMQGWSSSGLRDLVHCFGQHELKWDAGESGTNRLFRGIWCCVHYRPCWLGVGRVPPKIWLLTSLWWTYNQGTLVVLLVLLEEEDVDAESHRGVEKGKDADGDEELGRGGVVTNQEETLLVSALTGGGIKIHLVESERGRGRRSLKYFSLSSRVNSLALTLVKSVSPTLWKNVDCWMECCQVSFRHSWIVLCETFPVAP